MNTIVWQPFFYSLVGLVIATLLSAVSTSILYSGDAGLTRLIERGGRHVHRLIFWQSRWELLCKAGRLLSAGAVLASAIFFDQAFKDCGGVGRTAAVLFLFAPALVVAISIVPRVLAESLADRVSLAALPLMAVLTPPLYPFVWLLQKLEDWLLCHAMQFADDEDRPSTEDEIISLIDDTDEEDLDEEEREIIRSVFEFGETVVREIMIPRIDIFGVSDTLTVGECIERVKTSRHSRFPVYHENIDDVIGVVHVKELLLSMASGEMNTPVVNLARKIDFVPETMPLNDLLQSMKKTRLQIVLVVDEYGGTEGLVTMEDVIEELVGEIEDEFDLDEQEFHRCSDGSLMVKARISIAELNDAFGTQFPESDEYDSLGGYVFFQLGRIPKVGETLTVPGYLLRIHSASPRAVQVVQLAPHSEGEILFKSDES